MALAFLALALVPWTLAEHDAAKSAGDCPSGHDFSYDHDRDCVPNNRDRAAITFASLNLPDPVWLGQEFLVQGQITSDEDVQPPAPVQRLTVLVVANDRIVGAASRTAGVGFTASDGTFSAASSIERSHRVTVPAGHVLFGHRHDADTVVDWHNFNLTRVDLGPNPLSIWSYATDPLAVPGDPNYVDLQATYQPDPSDASTAFEHRTHAVGRAVHSQFVTVRTETDTRFSGPVTVLDGDPVALSLRVLDGVDRPLPDQQVTVTFQGIQETVDTGSEGVATATFEDVDFPAPGAYTARAVYSDAAHDYTEGSSGETDVFVRFPTSLTVQAEPATAHPGHNVVVSGRLTDHRGVGVGGQAIRFLLDERDLLDGQDVPRVVTTAGNGRFSFQHPIDAEATVGVFPLQALFEGSPDGRYVESTSDAVTLTVKRPAHLVFEEGRLEATRDASVQVAGTFSDNAEGTPPSATGRPIVAGTRVTLEWGDGTLVPAKTAFVAPESGTFEAEMAVPADHPLGPTPVPVRVLYEPGPQDLYEPGHETRDVHVVTDTRIVLEGGSFPRGTTAVIEGKLLDDQDAPVPDQAVAIQWDEEEPFAATTDAEGRFRWDREVPADAVPRIVPVTASFAGSPDGVYRPSAAGPVDHVVIATTAFEVQDAQLLRGPVSFPGRLVDDHDDPVQGTVRVRLTDAAGEHVNATAVSGPDGTFAVQAQLDAATEPGPYTATYSYAGEPPFLLGSKATAAIDVVAATVIDIESVGALVRGHPFQAGGSLREDFGAPVAGAVVHARLDDRDLGQATTVDGRFTLEGILPQVSKGEHTLSVSFAGAQHLLPSEVNVTVIVKAATLLDIQLPATVTEDGVLQAPGRLTDDTGQPVAGEEVCVQTRAGSRFQRPDCVVTDEDGAFLFQRRIDTNATVPIVVGAQYNGSLLHVGSTFGEGVVPVTAADSLPWSTILLSTAAVVAVAAALAAAWYFLLRPRMALRSIHDILQDVIYDLEAGSPAAAAIIEAYERLERSLRRNGYLRRRHETVREFEQGLVSALGLAPELLSRFLGVFEVARYSQHAIGPDQQAEALRTFEQVDRHVTEAMRRAGPGPAEATAEAA